MNGYDKVPLTEENHDQEGLLIEHDSHSHKECSCSTPPPSRLPWILCGISSLTAILAALSSVFLLLQTPKVQSAGSYPTDFQSAPSVPYVEKYLYNFYDFNPTNHLLEFNYTGVDRIYAGAPTKSIDDAWNDLLQGRYIQISPVEAEVIQKAAPWELEKLDGNVYAELGVYHNLHCLNLVRRALDPDHYNLHKDFTAQLDDKFKRVHVYHCIDQLRQAIECHSDLTPAPLFSSDMLKERFYASHSVSHTCRNFEVVKDWIKKRNEKNPPFDWSPWSE